MRVPLTLLLLLLALVCFGLTGAGVRLPRGDLMAWGLTFLTLAQIIPLVL